MEYVLIYARNKTLFKANKPFDDYSTEKFVYEIKELKPGTNFEVGDRKVTVFKKDEFEIVEHDQSSLSLLKATWVTGSIYSGTGHGKTFQKVVEPRINIDGLGCIYKVYGLGDDGLGYRYFSGPTKPTSKFGKMYTGIPTTRLEEINNGEAIKYRPIINYYDFSPDFGNIRSEGGIAFNSGKKPIKMLKQFINYHPNKNAVVLDFFAGSGSTGHAVLDLNKEDNGNRKFILCTNNENNICDDITYPRLKNIIEGYSTKEALGGNLQYYKTDFVDNIGTRDQLYYDLTEKCIPMLCVKESTFDKVEVTKEYAIYSNKDQTKFTGVYFDIFGQKYNDFLEKISGIKQHKELYIFSLGNEVNVDDLSKINDYNIEAIPYKILDLYKRIVKMSKED